MAKQKQDIPDVVRVTAWFPGNSFSEVLEVLDLRPEGRVFVIRVRRPSPKEKR